MLLILFVPSSNFLKDSTLCVPKGATYAVYSGKYFYFFFFQSLSSLGTPAASSAGYFSSKLR